MKARKIGSTMVELLVAMAILALLCAILNMVFSVTLKGWRRANNMLIGAQISRFVMEQMSREIQSAMVQEPHAQFYMLGLNAPGAASSRTNSIADELYFIAPLNPGDDNRSDLCEVGYWLHGKGTADPADDELRRFYFTDDRKVHAGGTVNFDFNFSTPAGNSGGAAGEFAAHITDLQFTYLHYDRTTNTFVSYAEWDSRPGNTPGNGNDDARLPAALRIQVTVSVGKGTAVTNPDFYQETFTRILALPQRQ
ncbi:MAG: prepilin-type N-terminal cleavage/methylation domain-containing protein [Candidatus Omnitrophica bacterium]|nr:prepilin-type N-terminal cleavage/methylation domain-containing protein [Candidatus Omnitrophota bacterium]